MFDRSRAYGALVHKCRSSLLAAYINGVLNDMKSLLKEVPLRPHLFEYFLTLSE